MKTLTKFKHTEDGGFIIHLERLWLISNDLHLLACNKTSHPILNCCDIFGLAVRGNRNSRGQPLADIINCNILCWCLHKPAHNLPLVLVAGF